MSLSNSEIRHSAVQTTFIYHNMCESPQMTEVLPLLYLHGLSSGDFAPALEAFLGTGAGLSASAITRLTVQWQDEARAFAERDPSEVDYVYLWSTRST